MTRLALNLLHRFGINESLIGDLLEEFQSGRSPRVVLAPDSRGHRRPHHARDPRS